MKIYIDKIPPEGLELQEQIEPRKIALDLKLPSISFTKSIDVKARVSRIGDEIFVDLSLKAPVEYRCSRCLVKIEDILKKHFNINHEVGSEDILEIDEDIRQEMILDYPMKVVCRPDCKGLCPNCGQNLNIAGCECTKDKRGWSIESRRLNL